MIWFRRLLFGHGGHVVRSLLLIIGVASLPLALLLALRTYQDSEQFKELRFSQAENVVDWLSFAVQIRLEDAQRDFRVLERELKLNPPGSESFTDLLKDTADEDFYLNVVLSDAEGRIIQSAKPVPPGLDHARLPAFQRARDEGRFIIGGYFLSPTTGKPSLHVAQPVYDADGAFAGMLTAAVSFDFLRDPLDATVQPGEFSILLTDAQGIRLFRYPRIPEDSVGQPVSAPLLQKLRQLEGGGRFEALDAQGVARHVFAQGLGLGDDRPSDLYVVTTIPVNFLRSMILGQIAQDLLLLALVNLGCMGTAWYLAQRTLRLPLRILCERANALALGEYDDRQIPLPATGEFGELAYAFGRMSRSIAQRDRNLRRLVMTDTLTGLPNRRMLREDLETVMTRDAGQDKASLALACLDVERFHVVNDSLGHSMGDSLLTQLAARLAKQVGERGRVYRLGGDEFAILITPAASLREALKLVRGVSDSLKQPFTPTGGRIHLHVTFGLTASPPMGLEPTEIIRNANLAMQHTRRRGGGNKILLFTDKLLETARLNQFVESELETAIRQGDVKALYQPIVEASTGRVLGVETLARWRHPQRGFISPAVFIPVAEENKLIAGLGEHILIQALKDLREMRDEASAPEGLFVTVNVSARQLDNYNLPVLIKHLLDKYGLSPDSLHLEITETAAMEVSGRTSQVLKAIAALGVPLSMDDFGTGYSNLAQLARLSFHTLKVDASITRGIESDNRKEALLRAVVAMARSLGLHLVAEGVETDEQRRRLLDLGLSLHQGFHYARPVPKDELAQLVGKSLPLPLPPAEPAPRAGEPNAEPAGTGNYA